MKKLKLGGFTLIEVLIAILILSMSIVLILGIITSIQRLRNTAYSKSIGTMLSKEGIELFYNMRNSNIMDEGRDLDRNCISVNNVDGSCQEKFTAGNAYTVSINPSGGYIIKKRDSLTDDNIYICESNGIKIYTHTNNTGCTKSEFRRYINIGSYQGSDQIYTINSVVEYNKNGFSGSVNLQSTIGNI